ncbi:H(+) Cl(-) exchange transporter [Raphidocelis subcapitata]|uniref:Chloride channel protein n=1 Tax=Raphidocelis subcapitata TaxID=307507 RepID=A0A2V0PCS7_9CHLO|nr:H(+) Cl(-) exchange transporter [Raphidocelis subcapitata]|eukprot:GBF97646.1 H(+) Cl(-) exchange transporter [Raphidocelis subcapitata]
MDLDGEHRGLLAAATFREQPRHRGPTPSAQELLTRVWGTKNAPTQRVSESLDYEPVQNAIFYKRMRAAKEKKHLFGYTGHTFAKFIITIATGMLTGVFAVGLSKIVGAAFEWKNEYIQSILDAPGGGRIWIAFLWHCAYSCCLVSFAVALVQYWAPQSAGAGVTLVMAYLNGNHVPNLLRLRTLVSKFVGTLCSVAAGLPMGPEGPMVHMGACVASVITYAQCTCLRTGRWLSCFGRRRLKSHEQQMLEKMKVLDDIVSDADHREFVSAGAAAGISAAFGAPVGGVLWAMEEACSFWNRKTAWRCFIAGVCSTFMMSQLNKNAAHGMIGFQGVRELENRDWLMQLPFVMVNAAVAGLWGAAFNSGRMTLWRVRASKTRHVLRIAEVIGLAILVQMAAFFFSWAAGRCLPKNPEWGESYGFRFTCREEGTHNDLATLFLSSGHDTIIRLFSVGAEPGQPWVRHFTQGSLLLFLLVYVFLMSIGAGTAIPGGLFVPSILAGATSGGLLGSWLRMWLPGWNIQPGLYSLMAATATLGGVFRNSISLVVLVMEGTRSIEYMGGIILSVVVANWVAHQIHREGVYESELERIGNLYFLRDEAPHRLHCITAERIMATPVVGFPSLVPVSQVLSVLRATSHNGFPVYARAAQLEGYPARPTLSPVPSVPEAEVISAAAVAAAAAAAPPPPGLRFGELSPASPARGGGDGATGAAAGGAAGGEAEGASSAGGDGGAAIALEGLVLRSQLLVLLQRRHFCDAEGRPVGREADEKVELDLETEMRTFFRRYFTHNRYVSATATPIDALQLDTGAGAAAVGGAPLAALFLDLRPFVNRSPFTVRKDCSGARAHQAFVSLGLRHLLVVDAHNRVAGIVTRKDLDHAAGHGWWRMSAVAPKPHQDGGAGGAARLSGLNGLLDGFRRIPSYGFLKALGGRPQSGGSGAPGGAAGSPGGAARGKAAAAAAAAVAVKAALAPSGSPGGTPRAPGALLGVGRDPGSGGGGGGGSGRTSGAGEAGTTQQPATAAPNPPRGGAASGGGGGGGGGRSSALL